MSGGENPNPHNITDAMWRLWDYGLAVLEPTSQLGGIYAFKAHFHNTIANNERWWPLSSSIRDAINRLGPRDKAAAIDWTFPEAQRGDYRRINLYSARLDAASRARDPRLAGWYEWFGTRDGANIGWNIYQNRFSSSDDSHDWHIHLSEIRAYVQSWTNKAALLSVLSGETLAAYLARGGQLITSTGDDDMFEQPDRGALGAQYNTLVALHDGDLHRQEKDHAGFGEEPYILTAVKGLAADVTELKDRPPVEAAPVDPAALKAALMDPEFLAAVAKAVNDEDHARSAD